MKHSTDTLSEASIQQSFNLKREAQHRRKDIQQTHELIEAEAQQSRISLQSESSARQAADVLEAQTRTDMDTILQVQINDLVAAVIKVAINDYQARERFRESIDDFYQVMADSGNMTYMGARVASSNEIGDMLSDVFSGSDDGEVYASEIPEELRDRVASSSEVSEILAEIFNPKN